MLSAPNSPFIEWISAGLFALAILHTFLVSQFQHIAQKYPAGSVGENFFHLMGEVEIVFGIWAFFLLIAMAFLHSPQTALHYLESRNFTEPAFVFMILAVCSTQPILDLAESLMTGIARLLPLPPPLAFFATALCVGPILGSFITEPAAMTVTALLLLQRYYQKGISIRLKYATLGVLFVNISIGGTLTPFAAPPVLMVASQWGWGLREMLTQFGWKGALACVISTSVLTFKFRKELKSIPFENTKTSTQAPLWVQAFHLIFLIAVVAAAHRPILAIGIFLFFLGFAQVTNEYQKPIRLKEGLLVAFFLGGLVVLGGMQAWWLEPILNRLTLLPLYLSAIGLTAITDNAAITYLGSLVPTLSETSRYLLVAGAVVGGGLTVIANAPNPAGFNILQPEFGEEGISPLHLLRAALFPTCVAALCFWFF